MHKTKITIKGVCFVIITAKATARETEIGRISYNAAKDIWKKGDSPLIYEEYLTNTLFKYDGKETPYPLNGDKVKQRFKEALIYLESSNMFKYGYDYAWIYVAIQKNRFIGSNWLKTDEGEFVKMVRELKIQTKICDRSGINRHTRLVLYNEEPWDYSDCSNDSDERERRNSLINVFIEKMSNI